MAEMNPQRIAFKENYCNPESDTFGNIKQSALKAGFSESYSEIIMSDSTGNEWVKEIIRDYELLSKAESNLKELLNEVEDKKVKADITKFVAKTLGKNKYSERQELTGKDGEPVSVIGGFNYIKPNEEDNTDNQTDKETTSSVGETA